MTEFLFHNLTIKVFSLNHIALCFNRKKITSQIITTLTIIHLKTMFKICDEINSCALFAKKYGMSVTNHTSATDLIGYPSFSRMKNDHGQYN